MNGEVNRQESDSQPKRWAKIRNGLVSALVMGFDRYVLGVKGAYPAEENTEEQTPKLVLNLPSPAKTPALTHSDQGLLPSPDQIPHLITEKKPLQNPIVSFPSTYDPFSGDQIDGFTTFAPEFSDYDEELKQSQKVHKATPKREVMPLTIPDIDRFSQEFESAADSLAFDKVQLRFQFIISEFQTAFPINSEIWSSDNFNNVSRILGALTMMNRNLSAVQANVAELESSISVRLQELMSAPSNKDWDTIVHQQGLYNQVGLLKNTIQDKVIQHEYAMEKLRQKLANFIAHRSYSAQQFAQV